MKSQNSESSKKLALKKRGQSLAILKDDYLYQSHLLYEIFSPRVMTALAITMILTIISAVIWAYFTPINKLVSTSGQILPTKTVVSVKHFDGGIVRNIFVHEGAVVKKGQVLFLLSGAGSKHDLKKDKDKLILLKLQNHRLNALLNNTKPKFKNITHNRIYIKEQQATYDNEIATFQQELNVIKQQLNQKVAAVKGIADKINSLHKQAKLSEQMLAMYVELRQGGHAASIKLLEEKQKHLAIESQIQQAQSEQVQLKQAVSEYKKRIAAFASKFKKSLSNNIEKVNMEIALLSQTIAKKVAHEKRLAVRSPASGLVKSLELTSVGDVVAPGKELAEIIPSTKRLQAEIKIDPIDVGSLTIGQGVRIKISAYDYIQYGVVNGVLKSISPSTFEERGKGVYFKGIVEFKDTFMPTKAQEHLPIIAGMTVSADIITGKQTVMKYILKPIYRAFSGGFAQQ